MSLSDEYNHSRQFWNGWRESFAAMEPMNIDTFTMQDLRSLQASIRDDMNELDGQFERGELIEQHYWNVMDEKVLQYGQVREAMAVLAGVTFGEAKSIKEWVQ